MKQTRAFCGMVNFLSSFLPNLRRLLIPVYDLQKKSKKFKWTEEAEKAFNDIKELLISQPVLKAPTPNGLFCLEVTHLGKVWVALILVVFFIRYQKTMQAMLMTFITMNTSNSGNPSTKANPINRTFPPLFTIKISEEEKIAEDLHKIESMQLIAQVIMIIVCILIAFIVMYYCCKKFRHMRTLFKYCFPFLPISRIMQTS